MPSDALYVAREAERTARQARADADAAWDTYHALKARWLPAGPDNPKEETTT